MNVKDDGMLRKMWCDHKKCQRITLHFIEWLDTLQTKSGNFVQYKKTCHECYQRRNNKLFQALNIKVEVFSYVDYMPMKQWVFLLDNENYLD